MGEIATRSTGFGLINRADLAKGLNNAAMSMPAAGGTNAYLKMDKNNGDWVFGQEETVVEPDSLWAVNPLSLKHGWVAWDTNAGGPPVQEIMVSALQRALPARDTLPELPMGTPDKKSGRSEQLEYQGQRSVELTCISGEDTGTTVEYKQSSTGAMKLFGTLITAIEGQANKGDLVVPIVKLSFDKYKHKQYGNIINPIFKIEDWRALDDGSPVEDTPEDEPAPRTRAAAAQPKDEPADEDNDIAEQYAAEQAAQAGDDATPRRRQRR